MLTRHENTRLFKRKRAKIDISLPLLTHGIKIQGFPKETILFFIEKILSYAVGDDNVVKIVGIDFELQFFKLVNYSVLLGAG